MKIEDRLISLAKKDGISFEEITSIFPNLSLFDWNQINYWHPPNKLSKSDFDFICSIFSLEKHREENPGTILHYENEEGTVLFGFVPNDVSFSLKKTKTFTISNKFFNPYAK